MAVQRFDVVVIGGGSTGENAAARAARGGLSTALVEQSRFGGECSYYACMPSKALLRPGDALAAAQRLPGVPVGEALDAAAVLARRDAFAAHWDDADQYAWVTGAGVTPIRGKAHLTGPRRVAVAGGPELVATHAVVLCTGSVPHVPAIEGLPDVPYWTSREATTAGEVPRRLVVVGGGVVGVEMAQAWAQLGAEVDLVVRGERLLAGAEPFAGELVAARLRAAGVSVRLRCEPTSVARSGEELRIVLDDGRVLVADRLLMATGRRPATLDIGAETVGLVPDEPVTVDDSGLVTAVDGGWLYAAGDVTGRAPLTHQGKYAARVVGDVIAARAAGARPRPEPWSAFAATADHGAVPQVVFTDPQVAWVGRTAARAERDGIPHRVVELDIAVAGSALHADGYTGRACMIVDTAREVLLGVTFTGPDVAELLHAATIAVVGEVPLRRLWHAVPAYPTISEVWLRLLEKYGL